MSFKLDRSNSTYSSKTDDSLTKINTLIFKIKGQLENDKRLSNMHPKLKKERSVIFFKKISKIISSLNYSEATFFLALKIFDKYFERIFFPKLDKNSIFKIALVCLELASKLHEKQIISLRLKSFSSIIPDFNLKEMQIIEKDILFKLNFKVNFYTGYDILRELYVHSKEFSFINLNDEVERQFFERKLKIAGQILKNLLLNGYCEHIDDFHLAIFIFNIECQENWNDAPYKHILEKNFVENRSYYQKKIFTIKEVLYNGNAPMIF